MAPAPVQRESLSKTNLAGPSLKEPRRSEPVPRASAGAGSRGLRGSSVVHAGAENNVPPQHSKAAWQRTSPKATRQQRPTTTTMAARSAIKAGQAARSTAALRDLTNIATQNVQRTGKTLKPSLSARTVMHSSQPLAVKETPAAKPPSNSAMEIAVLADCAAPSPAQPEDLEPFRGDDGPEAQRVSEYAHEIFELLFREEAAMQPKSSYMEAQPEITSKMRAILVDWLIEVHMKYRLRPEVLFLSVNLIDRYLSVAPPVSRKKLQLVGVAAMFVAAKFEEIDPPNVHNFVYITDNAYTKEEVLEAECSLLAALRFDLVTPTADQFLERLLRAHGCESRHCWLARYVLELSLVDFKLIRHRPSYLAAAAVLLSNEVLGQRTSWPPSLARCARYSEQALRPCVAELKVHLENAPKSSFQAARKKFQSRDRHSAASLGLTGSA